MRYLKGRPSKRIQNADERKELLLLTSQCLTELGANQICGALPMLEEERKEAVGILSHT